MYLSNESLVNPNGALPDSLLRGGRVRRHSHSTDSYPCPRCSSLSVRDSRVTSWLDLALLPLLVTPFRCHRCYLRFRAFKPFMHLAGRLRIKRHHDSAPSDRLDPSRFTEDLAALARRLNVAAAAKIDPATTSAAPATFDSDNRSGAR